MNATIFYAPDAIGSDAGYFFDGVYMYERVHGLGTLNGLHGWLRRIGRKLKKGFRKLGKGIKRIAKKAWKGVKKVGKVAFKVIKKALPIVNTALTFIPGVGWAAKAALTVAEMGTKAIDKAKKRKLKRRRKRLLQQAKALNKRTTRLAKPAKPINPVSNPVSTKVIRKVQVKKPAPIFTALDFIRINEAVNRNKVKPEQVAQLARQFHQDRLQTVLNY